MYKNIVATRDGTILFMTWRRYKLNTRSYFIKINNKIMEFVVINKIKDHGRLFYIINFINTIKERKNENI